MGKCESGSGWPFFLRAVISIVKVIVNVVKAHSLAARRTVWRPRQAQVEACHSFYGVFDEGAAKLLNL